MFDLAHCVLMFHDAALARSSIQPHFPSSRRTTQFVGASLSKRKRVKAKKKQRNKRRIWKVNAQARSCLVYIRQLSSITRTVLCFVLFVFFFFRSGRLRNRLSEGITNYFAHPRLLRDLSCAIHLRPFFSLSLSVLNGSFYFLSSR